MGFLHAKHQDLESPAGLPFSRPQTLLLLFFFGFLAHGEVAWRGLVKTMDKMRLPDNDI